MNRLTHDDKSLAVVLLPLALGIAIYLAWCLVRGRISLRSMTYLRRKDPFGFWWDFTCLALFDGILWLAALRGMWAFWER